MNAIVQFQFPISIALAHPSYPYGEGLNLQVGVEFKGPLSLAEKDLSAAVKDIVQRWDHRHLALDHKPSLDVFAFAKALKEDLQHLSPEALNLKRADGWQFLNF